MTRIDSHQIVSLRIISSVLVFTMLMNGSSGFANGLYSLAFDWNTVSIRPVDEEQTPNLFGYGIDAVAGYRLLPIVSANLFSSYEILNPNVAKFISGSSSNLVYGLELGLRIEDAVAVGFRYGAGNLKLAGEKLTDGFEGDWQSNLYGINVAGYRQIDRERYLQVGLRYLTGSVSQKPEDANSLIERRVDVLSFYVSFLLMGRASKMRPFSLF